MPKILVVDDEQAICWGVEKLGKMMGHQVFVASSAEQGLRLAAECEPDVLVLDVRLPGIDGLTAMQQFRRHIPKSPIVVMTAFGDLNTAVTAVQNGAFEYLLKPFDLDEIRATIHRALLANQVGAESVIEESADEMLGKTSVMQAVFKRIALAASSDVSVLIQGESGTGKATAARAIHTHSVRSKGPFVTANLAGLDPAAAEIELFGQANGDSSSRTGLLNEANGGTLFLEDSGLIPFAVQAKLARAIEMGSAAPVGGELTNQFQCRIIAATDENLLESVQAGTYRQDLFCQLNAFEIFLPPLRDRVADIPLLVRHFATQQRGTTVTFAEETLEELQKRPWYGNVRELHNAIEHALVMARAGLILPQHLPAPLPELNMKVHSEAGSESLGKLAKQCATGLLDDPQAEGFVYERFLQEVEPPLLESAMNRYSNECAPAARALGLHRTTLKRKLDQYGIEK